MILQGFPGYSSIDNNVALYEIQLIEDLIDNVNNTQKKAPSDNDEDEDESTPILLNAQALLAVNDLTRYVTSLNPSEDAQQKLNYVENLVIANASKSFYQTKISDYFK